MPNLKYFLFESDFVEDNIRCIPMVVRMRLDLAGVKFSLSAWSKCSLEERAELATLTVDSRQEREQYRQRAATLMLRCGETVKYLVPAETPDWENPGKIPDELQVHTTTYGWSISLEQWCRLEALQRFALIKLCRPGHENRNFPHAMREFKLIA